MHDTILPPNPIEELEQNKKLAEEKLTGKELYELKKKQKEETEKKERRREKLKKAPKKISRYALYILIVIGVIGLFSWVIISRPKPEAELKEVIVAEKGIHLHPNLTIKVLGQYQDIPADIGISSVAHQPIHTHKSNGILHIEYPALVREKDLKLGRFFEVWRKQFNKDCIFDKCNGPEGQVKMFVNGEENFEFENYLMQDKDKIEIVFE